MFNGWLTNKMYLLGMALLVILFLSIALIIQSVVMRKSLANAQDRIMWHNKNIETSLGIGTIFIILIGGILIGVLKPVTPELFPLSLELPSELVESKLTT